MRGLDEKAERTFSEWCPAFIVQSKHWLKHGFYLVQNLSLVRPCLSSHQALSDVGCSDFQFLILILCRRRWQEQQNSPTQTHFHFTCAQVTKTCTRLTTTLHNTTRIEDLLWDFPNVKGDLYYTTFYTWRESPSDWFNVVWEALSHTYITNPVLQHH